jgi:hypothetical protein
MKNTKLSSIRTCTLAAVVPTVDTLDRVNVQLDFCGKIVLLFPGMNAVDRACIYAGCMFRSDTGFSDRVSHENGPPAPTDLSHHRMQ